MKRRKYKLLLTMILAVIMVITPLQAFAGQSVNHPVAVKFQILYVDSSFNIGYNFGASETTTFICQYKTPHSDNAYNNHTIAISDIKAAADRLTLNTGYKIEGWTKTASANPTVNIFPAWIGNKTTACNKGNVIYLVAKSTAPPSQKPDKPSADDLSRLLENSVQIKCENNSASHSKKTQNYDLIPRSYTVGEIEGNKDNGYTCQVTVAPALYVSKYNTDTGETHGLDPSNQTNQSITLKYNQKNGNWGVSSTTPIVYTVKCQTTPPPTPQTPDKPSATDIELLLSDNAVTIECTNSEAAHNHITYGLIPETYEAGNVQGDADSGYTCNITILSPAEYVAKYNTDTSQSHSLDPDSQAAKTITLEYKDNSWAVKSGEAPVKYTVKCQTAPPPLPETPNKPSDEYLKEFFGERAVNIHCNNTSAGHNDKLYPLLDNSFSVGNVIADGSGGYSCDITIIPTLYVAKYTEDMGKAHALKPADQASKAVTFTWIDEVWVSAAEGPVNYTVACESSSVGPYNPPSGPTYYTIQWNNYDNSKLETDYCTYYTLPSYDGPTPVKPSDESFNYEFIGWDKEIARVTKNEVYTAQYKPVPVETPPGENPEGQDPDVPGSHDTPDDSEKVEPTKSDNQNESLGIPKTGDEANVILLILLGFAAALGAGACGLKISRRK